MSIENQEDQSVQEEEKQLGGLGLVPNEVVGYRIMPDQWNWTVVKIKRYGKDSKNAGQEYKESLSYHKNLEWAVKAIYKHVSAMEGKKLQAQDFDVNGNVASLEALENAFKKGEEAALWAVQDLESRLKEAGYDVKGLNRDMLKKTTGEVVDDSEESEQ